MIPRTPAEFGGQGLPALMTTVVNEMLASANMAFAMYPGLTQGAIAALLIHGTPAQKATYLPPMIAGNRGSFGVTLGVTWTDPLGSEPHGPIRHRHPLCKAFEEAIQAL